LVNLKNPGTYDLTALDSAPDWTTEDGWSIRSNRRLNTNFVPGSNTHTFILRYANVSTGAYAMGVHQSGSEYITLNAYSTAVGNYPSNIGTPGSVRHGSAVVGITPANAFLDGDKVAGSFTGWEGSVTYPLWLGAINQSGSPGVSGLQDGTVLAFSVFTGTPSDADMETVMDAMAAL